MDWSRFLPEVEKKYEGPKTPFFFLILVAAVSTARSLIHMFASDGGANIIAGIAVNVQGGANIIALFGQWGSFQLLMAIFYWVVIFRYRFLVPFSLGIIVLEQILRLGIGQLKPLEIASPPPGAIGSYILLPLALIALVWSLVKVKKVV